MFFGPTLSGDEFVGDVFWTYLFGGDVFWTYLFGGGRVAPSAARPYFSAVWLRPVLDLTFLPRGPAHDSLGLLGCRVAPFGF